MSTMIATITIIVMEGKMTREGDDQGQGPSPMREATTATSVPIATIARMTKVIIPLAAVPESEADHPEISKPTGVDLGRRKGESIMKDQSIDSVVRNEATTTKTIVILARRQSTPQPLTSQPSPSLSLIAKKRTKRSRRES